MFLEKIKLFNYRIFKHEITIENFCPGVNIFIGPNGSGKSSLFSAFRFLIFGKLHEMKKEIFKGGFFPDVINSNNHLMIQLYLNNSKNLFHIKEKNLMIMRFIDDKSDKIWFSGYDLEAKNLNEFFISNGMDLREFFLFFTKKEYLNFKLSNSLNCLQFFKKNSNFVNFSKYQLKIVLLMKKAIILKEKLSKLIKILTKKQKFKIRQKEKVCQNLKINFFIIFLDNAFKKFEVGFLYYIEDKLYKNHKKSEIKVIMSMNKIIVFMLNMFRLGFKNIFKTGIIKKVKKIVLEHNVLFLNKISIKNQMTIKIEKYRSITDFFYLNLLWGKIIFNNVKTIFHKNIHIFKTSQKSSFDKNKIKFFIIKFIPYRFKIDELKKQQKIRIYLQQDFVFYLSKKNMNFFLNSIDCFSRDIFLKKQHAWRFLDHLKYEIKFLEKILENQEKNLCRFFGSNISKNIRLISEISRNKKMFSNKINGILLDIIAVYKHFEKPVEAFLFFLFPTLIIENKEIIPLLLKELDVDRKIKINFIENKESEKIFLLNLKNSKMVHLNSFLFSNKKFSALIASLIGNTFLCTDSKLAFKFSKIFLVRTVTFEGRIFHPNGIISNNFLHHDFSSINESVMLKKERNFYKWLLSSFEYTSTSEEILNKIYKKQKKIELLNIEIKQFILFQKKKEKVFLGEHFSNFWDQTLLKEEKIAFLNQIDFSMKIFSRFKEKEYFNSINFKEKNNEIIKQIEIQKLFIKVFGLFFLKNEYKIFPLKFNKYGLQLKSLKTKHKAKINLDFKKKYKKSYIKNIFFNFYKPIKTLYAIHCENNFDLSLYSLVLKEINKKRGLNLSEMFKSKRTIDLRVVFSFLGKIKKKIRYFLQRNNIFISKKINLFIFKFILFYENLEVNLKILYQIFDVLVKGKILKLKKIAKTFSLCFQKNLNIVLPKAKSCLIWKEKRIQKIFKSEALQKKNEYIGVKILIKLKSNESFTLIENISKGQICISLLIFCLSLSIISKKTVFFFDEIDENMDFYSEILSSKLIKKFSSKGNQVFIVTHKKKTIYSGDKWFGVSGSKKGSFVENITLVDCKKFLSINN